jgi:pyridoxal phosphate enzyme (YggS family)
VTVTSGQDPGRAAELAEGLARVRERVAAACAAAGRQADEVTVIAVTKTFPVSDIGLLVGLGVADIGENRDQEAKVKAAECAARGWAVRWHFVGQLQVNKVASVARYADIVHSVDRRKLVTELGARARAAGRRITCLVQVSLDDGLLAVPPEATAGRGGASPADVPLLASMIAGEEGLVLGGVMAVAPLGEAPQPAFRRLRRVADQVRSNYPSARVISAGMSADLDAAIAEGATHVRVGTALLGGRPAFVR